MKVSSVLFAIALTGAATAANAANLVTNGSFESPVVSNWDNVSAPGWTTTNGAPGVELQTQATIGLTPADGNQYLEVNGNFPSTIVSDPIALNGNGVFSFAYAARVSDTFDAVADNKLNVLWDGNLIATVSSTVQAWTYYSFNVVGNGHDVITFDSTPYSVAGSTFGNLVDNVSVVTPIPAALFFVLPALAGVFGFSRRKTA